MKTTTSRLAGFLSAVLVCLAASNSSMAADKPLVKRIIPSSISVVKNQNNKKHRVRIYASGNAQVLYTVNGVEGKSYQLFIFTADSHLVSQATIQSGETASLNNMTKGHYFFDVLTDDEQVESGQLTIK